MDINERFKHFIERAKKVHGNKYDYSKVEYVNSYTNVCIICPEHGEFWQKPNRHVSYGRGCPKCGRNKSNAANINRCGSLFEDKARSIHGNRYDYSKVTYIRNNKNVCIICPEHGEFYQTPNNHLHGQGCPKCANIKNGDNKRKRADRFIDEVKKVHSNKYIYDKVVYNKNSDKIIIICPIHGEFEQEANSHLMGHGCPKCNSSHIENAIRKILSENAILYYEQKKFDWLGKQSLDFYLPDYNTAIECQGEQHFNIVEHFGGEKHYNVTILRDKIKKRLCDENGVDLIYYTNVINAPNEYLGLLFMDKNDLLAYIFSKKS